MKSHTLVHSLSNSLGLLFWASVLLLSVMPLGAHAASSSQLTATPVIIDEKVKTRDILNESISITNTSDHKMTLYPSINDVNVANGDQPFQRALDAPQASGSLSNWIQLTRGVIELNPGEEKTIPFVIQVPRDAKVGSYHARISFTNGSTREQADARGSLSDVTVNVDLQADIKELMQLKSFSIDTVVFTGDDALFKYQLQNIGNQPLDPKGAIHIYDRRGVEVASVNVNNEGKIVSPDQVSQLASVWSAVRGFGKYKAVIDVDYGTNQTASVQDATYFWVIPWKQVLGISIATLIGLILFAIYFEQWFQDWHLSRFAAAGLLRAEVAMHYKPPTPPTPQPVVPIQQKYPSLAHTPTVVTGGEPRASLNLANQNNKSITDLKPKNAVPSSLQERLQLPPLSIRANKSATAGTIDLKQMMPSKDAARPSEQHIINLKG